MKRFASTIAVTFAAILALPMTAIAQQLPDNPDRCERIYLDDYVQPVCLFHPTKQHDTLVVFEHSVQAVGGRSRSVDFAYLNLPHPSRDYDDGVRWFAQVDCSRPDHWHRFTDDHHSEMIPVESYAAERMVGFVCHEAGIY